MFAGCIVWFLLYFFYVRVVVSISFSKVALLATQRGRWNCILATVFLMGTSIWELPAGCARLVFKRWEQRLPPRPQPATDHKIRPA